MINDSLLFKKIKHQKLFIFPSVEKTEEELELQS